MQVQARVLGHVDEQIVVGVLLEIGLDGDVVRDGVDDAVDGGRRRRVADEQVAGGTVCGFVGDGEGRRTQRHHRDRGAGLHGARPRRRGARGFVQHDVDREVAGRGVGLGDRVRTLELRVGAVGVGEPEPKPRRRLGHRVVEKRRRDHAYPQEVRGQLLGLTHCGLVVARAEAAQHRPLEPACHERSISPASSILR